MDSSQIGVGSSQIRIGSSQIRVDSSQIRVDSSQIGSSPLDSTQFNPAQFHSIQSRSIPLNLACQMKWGQLVLVSVITHVKQLYWNTGTGKIEKFEIVDN